MDEMKYWQKIDKKPAKDLSWNLPENKARSLNIIGGNLNSFNTTVKISEYATANTHIKDIYTVFPDALEPKLPPAKNLIYLPSTASGSFADTKSLLENINKIDANLLIGDFSKNTITEQAIASACENAENFTLLTRDTIDLIANSNPEKLLGNENLIIFASLTQMQKLLRAAFYPKVLLLSMSLLQVIEVLHKFTLSYKVSIITFHEGQIIIAKNGKVATVAAVHTEYSPITIWSGHLAVKILEYNLFNPNNFLDATIFSIF